MVNKKFISITLILLMLFCAIFTFGCNKKKTDELSTVRLNEVVRSIFYAPMYVAINEGFFEEEGIDIDLSTGQGADKTRTQTQVLKQPL